MDGNIAHLCNDKLIVLDVSECDPEIANDQIAVAPYLIDGTWILERRLQIRRESIRLSRVDPLLPI